MYACQKRHWCFYVVGVFPKSDADVTMSCMMVSRKETTCRTFSGDSQLSLDKSSFCMDPLHDLLWRCALLFSSFKSSSHSNCFFLHSFAPSESLITAHSALKVDMRDVKELTPHLRDLAFTEPLLPVYPGSSTTRAHLALHMLGTPCQAGHPDDGARTEHDRTTRRV